MRVAFDTNVLISAVAARGLCADLLRAVVTEHDLIIGETVLTELRRNLRTKLRLSADLIAEYESFLRRQAIVVSDSSGVLPPMRDATDARVFAEAITGEADVFVTGDRDFVDVASQAPIPILPPRQFWEVLRTA